MPTISETIEFRDRATATLQRISKELVDISREAAMVNEAGSLTGITYNVYNLERSTAATAASTVGLTGKVKGLLAAYLSLSAAKEVFSELINMSDILAESTAKLNLVVDSEHTLGQLKDEVMDVARTTRTEYQATSNLVSKLAMNAGNAFNNSNEEVLRFTKLINESFVISGVNAREATGAITQLTQAMGSGELRGDELRSVLEQAPIIARKIEEYMGWETNSMKEHSQNGEVTAQIVKEAMFAASDEITEMFESMPYTWSQVATEFKNRLLMELEPILQRLNSIANNETFWTLMGDFITILGLAARAIDSVLSGLTDMVNQFTDYAFAVEDSTEATSQFKEGLYQVIAVLAYVGGFILGTVEDIAVTVTRTVEAFVMHPFMSLGSAALYVARAFWGVIDAVGSVIEWVGNNTFGRIFGESTAITDYAGKNYRTATEMQEKLKRDIEKDLAWEGTSMEHVNPFESGKSWYSKVLSWLDEDTEKGEATENAFSNMFSDIASTADNTSAIKDTLKASASELEYLRKIAERSAIALGTKQTINITMNNDNTITSDTDIDGIINQLITGTKNGMLAISEGVHA